MNCRILLSRSSRNYAPAVGTEDAKRQACNRKKIEMVGPAAPQILLRAIDYTKRADELPEITPAYFQKSYAGK
ncbi:hypothetical protein GCM10007161_17090 [Ignatzschineria indica]|uniref:Uncharacterized protein n=1 Tax=Ignatzschineria indica TaxID=472583 RepID=A0A2U2AJ34_9GAMM|nr:hypothetical protein [Ignatzschineria indica]PWD82663.1 hypothetical protein DC082_08560 [Ignatzschineria indica]GGZ85730.1 hypothetical protein GCM10007161_17090 [Ignatzschineria indica]